jgi:hypothetical protein
MSYVFNNPCYNCKKSNQVYSDPVNNVHGPCKDEEKIRQAITNIHLAMDGSHQGSGEILMMCVEVEPK